MPTVSSKCVFIPFVVTALSACADAGHSPHDVRNPVAPAPTLAVDPVAATPTMAPHDLTDAPPAPVTSTASTPSAPAAGGAALPPPSMTPGLGADVSASGGVGEPAPGPAPTASGAPIAFPSIGLGVSDLARSIAFYTGPMGMKEAGEIRREGQTETVLVAKTGGVAIALVRYDEPHMRKVKDVPVKLVFAVADSAAQSQRIAEAGHTIVVPGLLALDPDGYTIELMQQPGGDLNIFACGISVSDSMNSTAFYTNTFAMSSVGTFAFGALQETILIGGGLTFGIVIMSYTDGAARNYKDNPVKLVFPVSNAGTTLELIRQSGQMVVSPGVAVPALGNAVVGTGKDPDGYTIELLQR